MPKSTDLEKTWIPGNSRGTQTFTSPSSINIPYGRYLGTVSGRGASGNEPVGATWNTNYNTNYNTVYPVGTQPAATWNTNYNTNYNVVYPIANQPYADDNPPYQIATIQYYSVRTFESFQDPFGQWGPAPNVYTSYQVDSVWGCPGEFSNQHTWTSPEWAGIYVDNVYQSYYCQGPYPGTAKYNTNYNVAYPVGNKPIANQPAATWNTNYNVAYPIAAQPIANQPVATYTPGNVGSPTTVLGVTLPGGPVDTSKFPGGSPGTATPITATRVSYYSYPDNANYPVVAPPGSEIKITLE